MPLCRGQTLRTTGKRHSPLQALGQARCEVFTIKGAYICNFLKTFRISVPGSVFGYLRADLMASLSHFPTDGPG